MMPTNRPSASVTGTPEMWKCDMRSMASATVAVGRIGTLEEILIGPAHENDGRLNLFGALRTSMATTGYETLKEFQKAEVMVAPALQTEGKAFQRAQHVGMGA